MPGLWDLEEIAVEIGLSREKAKKTIKSATITAGRAIAPLNPDDKFGSIDSLPIPYPEYILYSTEPMRIAESLIVNEFKQDDCLCIYKYGKEWYRYKDKRYQQIEESEVRREIFQYLDVLWVQKITKGGTQTLVRFGANLRKEKEVFGALERSPGVVLEGETPIWLDSSKTQAHKASEYVVFSNGLLHLDSMDFIDPTPAIFTTSSLDVEWPTKYKKPKRLLSFLGSIWREDQEQIHLLQEWIAYILSGSNAHHKALIMIGPKRAGKGVIDRLIKAMLGKHNYTSPTLSQLGKSFGSEDLVDKMLASVPEAKVGKYTDSTIAMENILAITGGDSINVDKKHKKNVSEDLPVRFMVHCNEFPEFNDPTGVFTSRFLMLTFVKSFYGQEDQTLESDLRNELPHIARWALEDGLKRLETRGRFKMPSTSKGIVKDFSTLTAPVQAFAQKYLTFESGAYELKTNIYPLWETFRLDNGISKYSKSNSFSRGLLGIYKEKGVRSGHKQIDGVRLPCFNGLRLK